MRGGTILLLSKEKIQEGFHVGTRGVRRKMRGFVKFANNSHFF